MAVFFCVLGGQALLQRPRLEIAHRIFNAAFLLVLNQTHLGLILKHIAGHVNSIKVMNPAKVKHWPFLLEHHGQEKLEYIIIHRFHVSHREAMVVHSLSQHPSLSAAFLGLPELLQARTGTVSA